MSPFITPGPRTNKAKLYKAVLGCTALLGALASAAVQLSPAFAAGAGNLPGTWTMVHDDWRGTLRIYNPDQIDQGIDGACTYHYTVIDGVYTGSDGVRHDVRGSVGGRDPNRRKGERCPQTQHFVQFTIDFGNGQPRQVFNGYLFTQGRTMTGYTWWDGIPFGWYAVKQ